MIEASGPLLTGFLVALSVGICFVALWRWSSERDPVDERLREYGELANPDLLAEDGAAARPKLPLLSRFLTGFGLGPGLAEKLSRSGLPLTVPEFSLIMLGAAAAGFMLGTWRVGLLFGIALGAALAYAPVLYLRSAIGKRQRDFTDQLPDVLDLLIGSLRAGHGLVQAINTLVEQLPPPACDEFRRVSRAVELGLSIERALRDLANRIGTDDVNLLVTAITVQHEMGGNLAEILGTIAETVRDRIRMKREIRALTAQQRMTGFILGGLPVFLAVVLTLVSPEFLTPLFEPGWVRVLPMIAVVMMVMGFVVINRILQIDY